MRILALAILAIGTVSIGPAAAQTLILEQAPLLVAEAMTGAGRRMRL